MSSLPEHLTAVLADVLAVEQEPDGALTVRYDGTLASLRVVTITEGLELVSLTQILAWELPLTKRLRDRVTEHARTSQLGTVLLVEKSTAKTADIMLRYNFPVTGLSDDALRTLILLVLDKGADIGRAMG